MPAVTVVVIAYNDAANLGHAVHSVTRQTLRDLEVVVVDDASTDETPLLTARLTAADPRVRSVRLNENSGGCSRPRNTGLEHATGRYVTFLDSDDVLHRHACARLVTAARRTHADMVCGRYVRRHLHPRRYIAAHDELYLRPVLLETILDRPEQLRDTPSCSKLYRREFLLDNDLRFPEGLLFEDLLFTTQAYCTAKGIAVIPQLVYVWNVRRAAAEPSITNRRDLRNWRDRFEIHRRIDAYLDQRDAPEPLRAAKRRKFLDVDFALFLRQLREFAPEVRGDLLDVAREYVVALPTVPDAAATSRIGAFLTARRDLDRVMTVADYAAARGVASDLVTRDGRLFWTAAYLDSEPGRVALDVTETGLSHGGFAQTPFLATVKRASVEGTSLRLAGVVHDVLSRLAPASTTQASLAVSGRVGGAIWRTPVSVHDVTGGIGFDGTVDLAAVGRRMLRPAIGHELRLTLELHRGGDVARRPLTARDAELPAGDITLPTPWRAVFGDRGRVGEVNGRLVISLSALPGFVDGAIDAASLARYMGRRMRLRTVHRRRVIS